MTSCDLAQMRLTALMDGELPDADAREMEAHLSVCESCRAARRELENLLTVADTWQVPPVAISPAPPVVANATDALLREMAEELRELRSEVRTLRAEIAELRNGRTIGTPGIATTTTITRRADTAQLLPYALPVETNLLIGGGN